MNKLLVPQVPDPEKDPQRARRAFQVISDMLNGLVRSGILVQTADGWTLNLNDYFSLHPAGGSVSRVQEFSRWHTAPGDPDSSLGILGDFCLGGRKVFEKRQPQPFSPPTWVQIADLAGFDGKDGVNGRDGAPGPAGASGSGGGKVLVEDAAGDTTTWPMLAVDQFGQINPATDAGLTYNASTNTLTAGALTAATITDSGLTLGSVVFAGTGGLLSQDNTNLFWDDTNNWLGIGGAPTVPLDVASEQASTAATINSAIEGFLNNTPGSSSSTGIRGATLTARVSGSQNQTGQLIGASCIADSQSSATTTTMTGGLFVTTSSSTGACTNVIGGQFECQINAASSSSSATAGRFQVLLQHTSAAVSSAAFGVRIFAPSLTGSATIATCYGIHVGSPAAAGVTNAIGILIAPVTGAVTANVCLLVGTATIPSGAHNAVFTSPATTTPSVECRMIASQTEDFWQGQSTAAVVLSRLTVGGGFVFNENAADVDCRIEGDTDANLFYTDASTDRVGIGTATPGAKLTVDDDFAVSGVVSPTAFAASSDDLAIGAVLHVRVKTNDAGAQNFTGMTGGVQGRIVYISNIGTVDSIVIKHDATSTAANRFYCPNSADVTLRVNGSVLVVYDGTSSRWRVMGA
jgi:hypothetical protein